MNKIQKIWLAVCGSLFLVPEILWSPLWNFSYAIWFKDCVGGNMNLIRNNFLTNSDNANVLIIILGVQGIGFLGLFFWLLLAKLQKPTKIAGLVFTLLGIMAIIFAFVMFYSFRAWR